MSEVSVQPAQQQLSVEEEADRNKERRARVRQEMKEKSGSARQAFKNIDLNGSGSISSQEFSDGVTRMGVNWQQLTGLKRPRELFSLFDISDPKKFSITFTDLFPDEKLSDHRPSTPDFCRAYTKLGRQYSDEDEKDTGPPKWTAFTIEDKKQIAYAHMEQQENIAEKR